VCVCVSLIGKSLFGRFFHNIHCFVDFGRNYQKKFFRDSYRAIRDVTSDVNLLLISVNNLSNLFFSINLKAERFGNVSNGSL